LTDVYSADTTQGNEATECLIITLVKTKTDRFRKGHELIISGQRYNGLDSQLCPVFWFKRLQDLMKDFGIERKEIGEEKKKYLLVQMNGEPLATKTPNFIIKKMINAINIHWALQNNADETIRFGDPSDFGSHSCRHGGATAAHAAGISIPMIKSHGNWSSDTILKYIQPSMSEKLNVTSFLAKNITLRKNVENNLLPKPPLPDEEKAVIPATNLILQPTIYLTPKRHKKKRNKRKHRENDHTISSSSQKIRVTNAALIATNTISTPPRK
jgi:hypothetical protein